ncbi:glycine receptor subunit alpha-4-like [Lingula anatina]|uniref:Gamma-aminobutyric acid receptor subunit beta n=1 Tax=Lingula anatina TaxID=7574 RepID=A0A1S3ITX9_LINAN|nr:glycine receptor subunit alpha-4-like [Lingula anatina]|eukprot:XP_013401391.1 glycine receptor subunit alpha-4-like [Lingula anatina]
MRKSLVVNLVVLIFMADKVTSSGQSHLNKSSYEIAHQALVEQMTVVEGYDSRIRPHLRQGTPTIVRVNLAINSFSEFNSANMDFSVNLYLRQMWNDPRLALNASVHGHDAGITLSDKALADLWVPDLFFSNEKQSWRHDITTPNVLLRIGQDGSVLYSQRLSAKLDCLYDFGNFPMDIQTCRIEMHSYAYTTDDIIFVWSDNPVQIKKSLYLPEFNLEHATPNNCTTRTATGEYTCIYAEFRMRRDIRFYLLNIYAPTIVVVILSFLNFLIDPSAAPARVSIGLITVLTITTQSVSLQERLPRVSYIKAVDVWLASCLLFVVSSMLEYALVNVLLQREARMADKINGSVNWRLNSANKLETYQMRQLPQLSKRYFLLYRGSIDKNLCECKGGRTETETNQRDGNGLSPSVQSKNSLGTDSDLDHRLAVEGVKCKKTGWTAEEVDNAAKFLFGIGFLVFNVLYWCLYLLLLSD